MAKKQARTRGSQRTGGKNKSERSKAKSGERKSTKKDAPEVSAERTRLTPVAAVGASAGALEAFKSLLKHMPSNSGMAFVLVMHLDPTHESMMADLLGRETEMSVLQAEDGMRVAPDCVYIIPPNHYLSLEGDHLKLTEPAERRGMRMPIDHFFRSVAREREAGAIAVIMSGTGADGSVGAQDIKAHGGLIVAQEPTQAAHDGMPRSAVATGCVDYVLPVKDIPDVLCRYVRHPYVQGQSDDSQPDAIPPDTLSAIINLLRAQTKYDFGSYKKSTVLRRIARRMGLNHIEAEADYLALLRENTDEVSALFKDLLIGVTAFFREPEAWEAIKTKVVPQLLDERPPDQPIRVWAAGCATGEEPYSAAMLLVEQLQGRTDVPELQVFGTDIDEEALEVARSGCYPESVAADVTSERLRRHFVPEDEHTYRIAKPIRESVVFAVQNLIGDPPFSNLDLIICRNLLIYLEQEVQEKVIALFHFALRPGGYLFLGHSETVSGHEDLFTPVSKKWRIYRRIGPAARDRIEFPIVTRHTLHSPPAQQAQGLRVSSLEHLAQQLLVKEFAPAAVVINPKREVLYFYGPTSQYLEMPTGEPSLGLLDMAREGLRTKLRAALYKAGQQQQRLSIAARVKREGAYHPVQVTVTPVKAPRDAEGLLLVAFEDLPSAESAKVRAAVDAEEPLVRQLEAELDATREDLQSTIEELETSNEELKASNEEVMSMNEELQSTNEELETSKEELQSLNEELNTVNNQLSDKVQLLEATTNDLANLLSSTDTATIFLDTHLCIKRFTPAATKLFRLRNTDLSRPISDLSHDFSDDALLDDAKNVLSNLAPIEREVGAGEENWYLRRVLPYRTEDNRIDGVVITFSDITQIKEAQHELEELNEKLEHRIEERTGAIRLLYDVASASNEADTVAQAVSYVLQRVCNYNGWVFGYVLFPDRDDPDELVVAEMRFELEEGRFADFWDAALGTRLKKGSSLPGKVYELAEAAWITNVADDWVERELNIETIIDIGTALAFPIMIEKRVVAVMEFFSDEVVEPAQDLIEAMQSVGTQLGRIIERKNLEKQAALATLQEQRRIGRELHDSVLQHLTGSSLLMASLLQDLQENESPHMQDAARIDETLREMQDQLRAISRGLMPVEVDAGGLISALEHLAERTSERHQMNATFQGDGPIQIDDNMTATNLYHIAQEAVHNAVKHAEAGNIAISLEQQDGDVRLTVTDDGKGMHVEQTEAAGMGRRIMRYRAGVAGASIDVQSLPQVGTTVTCRLPLPRKKRGR